MLTAFGTKVKNIYKLKQYINNICCSGWTALHDAAYFGNSDIMRTLLEAGANIEAQDVVGELDNHYLFKNYIRQKI